MSLAALSLALVLAAPGPAQGPGTARVRWERGIDEAVRAARLGQKPIMVDFWAEWCSWCRKLDLTTYRDPVVANLLGDFVALKVNTEGTPREREFASRYEVTSLPTIAFFSPEGRPLLRLTGFQGPGQFPSTLELARALGTRVIGWETALQKKPDDGAALTALGLHLYEQEFYDESRELLARAVKHDEGLPTPERKRTRMLLAVMLNHERRQAESEALLKDALALRPAGDLDAKLLYILARTYTSAGRLDEARATLQRVLDAYPRSPVAEKARESLVALDRP